MESDFLSLALSKYFSKISLLFSKFITSLASQPVHTVGVSELLGNNDSFRENTMNSGLRYDDLMKSPRKSRWGKDKYDLTSQLPKEVMESGRNLENSSDILEKYLDNAISRFDHNESAGSVISKASIQLGALLSITFGSFIHF
jgi:hypothetical protein